MIKRCEYCNSIWVCWNWFFQTKEKLQELNPHHDIKSDEHGHECWACEGVQITDRKVRNGIPYWVLRKFWRYSKEGRK